MENICEWDSCKKAGGFKAPTEKDNNKKFKWLCKDHIKLFNSKWDYFEGMSQDQIEGFLKSDLTWHRPTQKFSSTDNFFNILWNNALSDKFKILVKKFHPDKNAGSRKFEDKLKKITLAYSHLKMSMMKK